MDNLSINSNANAKALLQKELLDLYRQIHLIFIHSDCPKDIKTIELNNRLIQKLNQYNKLKGGRKTKRSHHKNHKKTRKYKKNINKYSVKSY